MKKLIISVGLFMALSGLAQEQPTKSSAIEGVKGVKQEAAPTVINKVEGVKTPAPNAVQPVAPPPPPNAAATTVNEVKGIKTPAPNAVQPVAPPPPPNAAAATTVNEVKGIKTPAPNAVKAVPPPPAGIAVSSIRPVKGVTGIVVPKQKNLEAALQIKEGGGPGGPKAAAAAAALGNGDKPGPPQPGGDGRSLFQEFEKLNTKGS